MLKNQGLDDANVTKIDGGYKVTVDNIIQIISDVGKVRSETGVEKNVGKEITKKKVKLLDENNQQIVVPVGFKIKLDSPTLVKDGIVVLAPDKSEFVWVPVENISTMYGIRRVILDGETKYVKSGKVYTFSKSGTEIIANNYNWIENSGIMRWKDDTSYREPDYLSDPTDGDVVTENTAKGVELLKSIVRLDEENGDIITQWRLLLQNDFDEMIKYVEENKGFYVGRYETSLTADSTKVQSKSGELSATASLYSCNTWYGLYQKQKEYSKKNGLGDIVGSSMIWGSQYDQMILWMKESGKDVIARIGNKRNLGKNNAKNAVGKTGTTETDKINNIYDLYGNAYEWTLNATGTRSRVRRGGVYNVDNSPSGGYNNCYPSHKNGNTTSRITLYVK